MSKEFSRRDFLIGSGTVIGSAVLGWFARDITLEEKREVQPQLTTAQFDRVSPGVSRDLIDNIEKIPAYTDEPLVPDVFAYTLDQAQFPILKPYEMRGLEFGRPSHKVFLEDKNLLVFKTNDAKWANPEIWPIAVYTRTGDADDFSPVERGSYSYSYAIDNQVPITDKDRKIIERYAGKYSLIAIRSEKDSPQVVNGIAENVFYVVTFQIRDNKLEPQYAVTLLV